MPLERRLQILLDERRHRRLESAAQARRVSVAAVVREAIDVALPAELERRRAAARRVLDAEPMPVSDVEELRKELGALRSGRLA